MPIGSPERKEVQMFRFDASVSSAVLERDGQPFPTQPQPGEGPLSADVLEKTQRYWQAANYLTIGQIYLHANPLLREPLKPDHIKPRLLGHWGTSPGLNLIYAHMTRALANVDRDMMYVIGPGHGGPALVVYTWAG